MTSGLPAGRISIALGLAFAASLASGMACAGDEKQFSGEASYYSENYKGLTASGSQYESDKFTCAHRTLPFGTRLRVTDRSSHRSVVVVVTDRGPFNKGRMIDLSLAAAKVLQMTGRGVIAVTATIENVAEKAATAATP